MKLPTALLATAGLLALAAVVASGRITDVLPLMLLPPCLAAPGRGTAHREVRAPVPRRRRPALEWRLMAALAVELGGWAWDECRGLLAARSR